MSFVRFKRRPSGGLLSRDIYDMDDFLGNRMWNTNLLESDFWNGKAVEPALNIKETDEHFEVELAAPGFEKRDFNITLEEGRLKIAAEKERSEEKEEENYTRREFNYSAFERSLQLPDTVMEDAVKATYEEGILRFKLQKKETGTKKPPKIIEVG